MPAGSGYAIDSKGNRCSNPLCVHVAVFAPRPQYPYQLRSSIGDTAGWTCYKGDGLYRLDIHLDTGRVSQVTIIKSAGSNVLDAANTSTFKLWVSKTPQVERNHHPNHCANKGGRSNKQGGEMTRFVEALTRIHVYEVRLRKDKRGFDLICDARVLALKLLLLLDLVLSGISFASAQPAHSSPAPHQSGKPKALAVYAPGPNYPKDAQGRRPTGSGIVVMEVDNKTGLVKSARMEKARAINFWMTLLFKPSVNGDLSPAVFRESIAP